MQAFLEKWLGWVLLRQTSPLPHEFLVQQSFGAIHTGLFGVLVYTGEHAMPLHLKAGGHLPPFWHDLGAFHGC